MGNVVGRDWRAAKGVITRSVDILWAGWNRMAAKCNAQLRGKPRGTLCKQSPIRGRTRCRLHGGKTVPAGPGHHNWKTGAQSKAVPKDFASRVRVMMADAELRRVTRDIASNRVQIDDAEAKYAEAFEKKDDAGQLEASRRIIELMTMRNALLSEEVRRYAQMKDTMRLPEVMALMGAMAGATRAAILEWRDDGKLQDSDGLLGKIEEEYLRLRRGNVRMLPMVNGTGGAHV